MKNDDFKTRIEAFLKKSGMAATTFGREALGDPGFVKRMRGGARQWPETQQTCLDFIAAPQQKEGAA